MASDEASSSVESSEVSSDVSSELSSVLSLLQAARPSAATPAAVPMNERRVTFFFMCASFPRCSSCGRGGVPQPSLRIPYGRLTPRAAAHPSSGGIGGRRRSREPLREWPTGMLVVI